VSSEANLDQLIPAWLDLVRRSDVALGLAPQEALDRAERLLQDLRSSSSSLNGWKGDADEVEVLHALTAVVCRDQPPDPENALRDLEVVFTYISSLRWFADQYGGPGELLAYCAVHGWRLARQYSRWPETEKWRQRTCVYNESDKRVSRVLSILALGGEGLATELSVRDTGLLLCLYERIRSQVETSPFSVREYSEILYSFLQESWEGVELGDENHHFQGEFALTAGTASRFLFKMDVAEAWLRKAEESFSIAANAEPFLARVAYQRLALAVEQRKLDEVLDLSPRWAATFRRLDMIEEALKCRFLEGVSHAERGETVNAIEIHLPIIREAEEVGNTRLVALAAINLSQFFAELGKVEQALMYARKALPLLERLDSRVHLVKLQISMARLSQKQGQLPAALDAYQQALAKAAGLAARGDVAAIHLVIADVLLEMGQETEAEAEVRAALPIIDEEKMVPEGIAALSLLRESLRRRQIDKQALRDLHGYFQEK